MYVQKDANYQSISVWSVYRVASIELEGWFLKLLNQIFVCEWNLRWQFQHGTFNNIMKHASSPRSNLAMLNSNLWAIYLEQIQPRLGQKWIAMVYTYSDIVFLIFLPARKRSRNITCLLPLRVQISPQINHRGSPVYPLPLIRGIHVYRESIIQSLILSYKALTS